MSAVGDARKRLTDLAAEAAGADAQAAALTLTLPGYFVAPDAFDDLWLWRDRGDYPVPVVARHDLRDDPDVWDHLTRGCEVRA